MDYRTVFLDLDNTLFSFDQMYERASRDAIGDILGNHRLGTSFDTFYERFRRTADALYFEYEKGQRTMDSYRDERWIRTFEYFQIPINKAELADLNDHIVSNYLQYVQPFAGTREFLEQLKQTHPIGLITNGPVEMQLAKLEKMDLLRYFDPELIIISEQLGVSKPDPKIFHTALNKAGSIPGEALHIGDSFKHDIVGANGVGMHSALIHVDHMENHTVPTYQFKDFFEAAKVLLHKEAKF